MHLMKFTCIFYVLSRISMELDIHHLFYTNIFIRKINLLVHISVHII